MGIKIKEIGIESLPEYAKVSIAFHVDSMYQVVEVEGGLKGLTLREVEISSPYRRDFDLDPNEGPLSWSETFDLKEAGFFLAQLEGETRGAATVFLRNPQIRMLEGRNDLALLWDIRVDPNYRGLRIGRSLFCHAVEWARERL